jgi:prolyl-tRNA synthetase
VNLDKEAQTLEHTLIASGLEHLVDDRAESAGIKFNDADLIGLPLRLTLSERSFKQGGVELKVRSTTEMRILALEQVVPECRRILESLQPTIPALGVKSNS